MDQDIEKIWGLFVKVNNISDIKKPRKHSRKKFDKTKEHCEKSLDLHGYTEDEAYDQIYKYLVLAKKSGLKRVIIVTGKGYTNPLHGEFRKGVLRSKFPSWMQYSELSLLIRSFKQAELKDGGDGAFYVFL